MCEKFDVSDLETDFDSEGNFNPPSKSDDTRYRKTFTCPKCKGSGTWASGKENRHGNARCWTCGGSGTVVTNPAKLAENRAKRAQKKVDAINAVRDENKAVDDGELLKFIEDNESWCDFYASLMEQHRQARRPWSEKQVAVARNIKQKTEASRAKKQQSKPTADGSRIRQMFDDALANGKKRRALHAGHFDDNGELINKITLTPARAPRTEIWVKVDGEFMGGIKDDGTMDLRRAPSWLAEVLQKIAKDPDTECRMYGQRTGSCSCCGRELTNAESIELGIGPICRERWGLV